MVVTEDPTYIPTAEDMAVYDALPVSLRKFLDTAPIGLDATTVKEFYEQKKEGCMPLYSDYECQQMVIATLKEYLRRQGVTDFRPLVVTPRKGSQLRRLRYRRGAKMKRC